MPGAFASALASHAVMMWFLLAEGLSTYGVLTLAAGESLLVGCMAIIVQSVSQRFPTGSNVVGGAGGKCWRTGVPGGREKALKFVI